MTNAADGRSWRHGSSAGFTLIELLIVVVLMAVLLGLAAPSVRQFMMDQRLKTTAVELVSTLNYVRSEALKRNEPMTLESVNEDWSEAWQLSFDGQELRVWEVPPGLDVALTVGPDPVQYLGNGRIGNTIEFVICSADTDVPVERRIVRIDPAGRPNVSRGDRCGL
jgi:type IV fimbrial biogenesis protein FimT